MTEAEKIRDHYRQKALHDEASQKEQAYEAGLEQGLERGIQIGRNEGEHQVKLATARNLLDLLDDNDIVERIGLPLAVVQKLRAEMK